MTDRVAGADQLEQGGLGGGPVRRFVVPCAISAATSCVVRPSLKRSSNGAGVSGGGSR